MDEEMNENLVKVDSLSTYSRGIDIIIKVLEKTEIREVTSRSDNKQHRVCEALVGDDTASIYLTLWDDAIDEVEPGMVIKISNGYMNIFRGSMRLNIGRYGSYEILEESPFEDVNREKNLSSRLINDPRRRKYNRRRD